MQRAVEEPNVGLTSWRSSLQSEHCTTSRGTPPASCGHWRRVRGILLRKRGEREIINPPKMNPAPSGGPKARKSGGRAWFSRWPDGKLGVRNGAKYRAARKREGREGAQHNSTGCRAVLVHSTVETHLNSSKMTITLIEQPREPEFDSFMRYLNDHLSDNGTDSTGYFQPLSRTQSGFPVERAAAFRKGLEAPIGTQSWRRAWVARNSINQIVGHVDLRAYPEPYARHRCLLGLGVDRGHRKQGIGFALLEAAQSWAIKVAKLEWIDLQVLSSNQAAIYLYSQVGFTKVGEVPEMFKIDGKVFSYTTMTKRLSGAATNTGA